MSNKRIDLWGTSFGNIIDDNVPSASFSKYDTLVWCELNSMYCLPKFVTKCMANNIKPICGVTFRLEPPEDCLIDNLVIKCYPEDEEGCEELHILCNHCNHGVLKYEDFCKFSNHLQVGLDIVFGEVEMVVIDNILEYVFVPDFVLIDSNQDSYRSWEHCRKILEDKNILICGCEYSMSLKIDDEDVLRGFSFLGDKAYEYVIENPRKIVDRISGNYKFDIVLLEKKEEKLFRSHTFHCP